MLLWNVCYIMSILSEKLISKYYCFVFTQGFVCPPHKHLSVARLDQISQQKFHMWGQWHPCDSSLLDLYFRNKSDNIVIWIFWNHLKFKHISNELKNNVEIFISIFTSIAVCEFHQFHVLLKIISGIVSCFEDKKRGVRRVVRCEVSYYRTLPRCFKCEGERQVCRFFCQLCHVFILFCLQMN